MAQHHTALSSTPPPTPRPTPPTASATPADPPRRHSRPRHRRDTGFLPGPVRRLLRSRFSCATRPQHRTPPIRAGVTQALLTLAATVLFICLAGAGSAEAVAGPVMAVKTLPEVINSATAWIVGILATLGVFFFTVGGLRYMWASGDPAEVEKAKGAFKGAAMGFALAVLAPVLMNILKQIVGA